MTFFDTEKVYNRKDLVMGNQTVKDTSTKRIVIVLAVIATALLIIFPVSHFTSKPAVDDSGSSISLSSEEHNANAEELEEKVEEILNYNLGADATASYIVRENGGADFGVSVNVNNSKSVFGYYLDLTLNEINTFLENNDLEISKFSITGYNHSKDTVLISWDSNDLSIGTLYDFSNDEPSYKFDISVEDTLKYCDYSPKG